MSTTGSITVREPKRERGHLRVAAIMAAGAEIFAEKGYDAATMTEIAARSKTAIGSLYRFFPTKEALADTLLLRYAQRAIEGLNDVLERTGDMSLDELSAALLDARLRLQTDSNFAGAVLNARGGNKKLAEFHKTLRGILAEIVRKALPDVTRAKAEVMAAVLLQLLRSVSSASGEKPRMRGAFMAEIHELIRLYLAAADGS